LGQEREAPRAQAELAEPPWVAAWDPRAALSQPVRFSPAAAARVRRLASPAASAQPVQVLRPAGLDAQAALAAAVVRPREVPDVGAEPRRAEPAAPRALPRAVLVPPGVAAVAQPSVARLSAGLPWAARPFVVPFFLPGPARQSVARFARGIEVLQIALPSTQSWQAAQGEVLS